MTNILNMNENIEGYQDFNSLLNKELDRLKGNNLNFYKFKYLDKFKKMEIINKVYDLFLNKVLNRLKGQKRKCLIEAKKVTDKYNELTKQILKIYN